MSFKYETHMHTSQGSDCSSTSGSEMVRRLHALGYAGCFITDHFFGGNTAVNGDLRKLPWEARIRLFCQGYDDAKRAGDELGFQVFFGLEFGWRATEFLTYGIDMQFLIDHPEIENMPLPEFSDLVHACGGFVIHAHPFREADYISTIRLFPHKVDGAEVYNCNNRDEYNARARWYAESYGIPATGGSDSHHWWCHPNGGVEVEKKFESPFDYLEAVRAGSVKILARDHSTDLDPGENPWKNCVRPNLELLPKGLLKKE